MRHFTFLLLVALVGKLSGEEPKPSWHWQGPWGPKETEKILTYLMSEHQTDVYKGFVAINRYRSSFIIDKFTEEERQKYRIKKIPESEMKRMRDQLYRLISDKRELPPRKGRSDLIMHPIYLTAAVTLGRCTHYGHEFRKSPDTKEELDFMKEWYVENHGEVKPEKFKPPIPEVKEQPKETPQEKKILERKKEESEHLQQENLQLPPIPTIEDYEDKPSPRQEPEVKKPTPVQEPEPKPDENDTQATTIKPSPPEKQSTNWATWAIGIIVVTPLIGFALRRYKVSA